MPGLPNINDFFCQAHAWSLTLKFYSYQAYARAPNTKILLLRPMPGPLTLNFYPIRPMPGPLTLNFYSYQAYARAPVLTINGGTGGFDGFR